MRALDNWLAETDGHANSCAVSGKTASNSAGMTGLRGLMVLGTDTDVGKSYVSELIIRHLVGSGLRVGAYKPVASGIPVAAPESDAMRLLSASGTSWPLERVCPQAFGDPLAPPIAAAHEGKAVDDALLRSGAQWWQNRCDLLVVEGAGGAMSPLSTRTTVLDLAVDLQFPVILVAAHRLGMMNHVLLTLEALRNRKLSTLALIINQVQPHSDSLVKLDESLACLLPFCGKIACYRVDYGSSTLSEVA